MADYSELKRKAQEIRDEVKAGANTANRVGLALEETVNALEAENQRAEQAEQDLQNAVQLLQDDTEDLQSIRDEVERLGSEKADKSALEATDKEVSKKQDKLKFYKEDPSNDSVEIFAQDVVSIQNDSQGGVSCVKVYNEEDTAEGLIPVAIMSAEKDSGDWASVTVRGNEVYIDGDAVKVNGVELGAKLDTINKELETSANNIQLLQDETEDLPGIREKLETLVVNDLTSGGADKALSAEMGKVLGEASIVDLGETTLEAVNARMREDALPSAERRTMVYKWRFADGGSGFALSVARLTNWGYCQYRAYKAEVEYRTVSGSGTPSNWLAWSGTHIKYDPATRKIGLAKWSDTGNETIQNSGETAELPLAGSSQYGMVKLGEEFDTQDSGRMHLRFGSGLKWETPYIVPDYNYVQKKLEKYTEDSDSVMIEAERGADIVAAGDTGRAAVRAGVTGTGSFVRMENHGSNGVDSLVELDQKGNIFMSGAAGTVNDAVRAIVSRESDGVELLGNGNIKLTLNGTTKEFMPATPSGDPMHYAYETAGAKYNSTTDFIVRDAPWKDMVDTIEDKAKWGFDVVDESQVKQMTIGGTTYNYVQTTRQSPEDTTEPRYFLVGQASDGTWVEDETKVLHLPGHWYLNGLGDITMKEMVAIYRNYNIVKELSTMRVLQITKLRTFFPLKSSWYTQYNTSELSGFIYAEKIEVIHILGDIPLYNTSYPEDRAPAIHPARGFIQNSVAKYLPQHRILQRSETSYKNSTKLRVVPVVKNKVSLYFNDIIQLSKNSIIYIVNNASPTTPITITLHADRYAQLAQDADVVAALEAKNTALEGTGGSVSLVSA